MKRRILTAMLSFLVIASAAPAAFAQDSAGSTEAPSGQTATDDTAPSKEASPDEATANAAADEDAAAGEAAAEAGGEGEAEAPSEGTVLGPGGKPLRTDYPGTDESLRPRMDTDKIEGMQIDPNKPQAAYGLRIRELETKIDDLKEKVFQSKTRIVLLRETLLSGNLAGARAVVIHRTELGSAFRLRQALYSLDGTRIYSKIDKDDDLADKRTFEIYNGSISPGNHNLSIFLKYQGSGYGVFSYFKGYDGEIRSACEFKAQEGKIAQIKVITFPAGGATTSIEERPNVRCEVQYFDNIRESDDMDLAADDASAEQDDASAEKGE